MKYPAQAKAKPNPLGTFAAYWGLIGVVSILGSAVYRLSFYAADAFTHHFSIFQWALLLVWTLFMAMSEGYRAFQKGFSHRVAARILYLSSNPSPLRVIFAPIFCMGYFGATRKRKIVTYSVTLSIIALICIVRQLAEPWRGIVDFGVVVGLTWGIIALLLYTIQAFSASEFNYNADVS